MSTGQPRRELGSPERLPRAPAAWNWVLVALFCAAYGWRLFYVYRLERSPLAGPLNADESTYWQWAGFLLREGPVGHNPFFMGPLYPYMLALVRLFTGDSTALVLCVQCLWGAAAVVLLADAARRLTRPAVGLAIGILIAGYQTAVLFDGLVLMESLLFFLECLLLWLVAAGDWEDPPWAIVAAVGLLIGLLSQGRALSAVLPLPHC